MHKSYILISDELQSKEHKMCDLLGGPHDTDTLWHSTITIYQLELQGIPNTSHKSWAVSPGLFSPCQAYPSKVAVSWRDAGLISYCGLYGNQANKPSVD